MSFVAIKDQPTAIRLLSGVIQRDRIPNGLLFWGPGGVGKRLTAVEFAKAVNCVKKSGDACDVCLPCRKTAHGNHADVKYVSPAGKKRVITVKSIEQINEQVMFRPFEGGMRVVVIDDADRITEDAQNHFLKTLEEPPSRTVFILATEWPRRLLPTIRSRCQSVRFGALRRETVADMLKAQKALAGDAAAAIAALSQGSMARALDLVSTDRREVVLDIVSRLKSGEDPLLVGELFAAHIQAKEKAIAAAVKAETVDVDDEALEREDASDKDGADKDALDALIVGLVRRELLEHLVLFDAWYRDELVCAAAGADRFVLNRDQLRALCADVDQTKQEKKLQALVDAWKYLDRNMNPQRIFRDLFFVLAK